MSVDKYWKYFWPGFLMQFGVTVYGNFKDHKCYTNRLARVIMLQFWYFP